MKNLFYYFIILFSLFFISCAQDDIVETTTDSEANTNIDTFVAQDSVENDLEVDLSKDTPKEGRYSRVFDGKGDQEKGIGLFFDYERLIVKKNSPDLDTLSAGVTYDF